MLTTVYLGGKCFGATPSETAELARSAMSVSKKLWQLHNVGVFCPITNCLLACFAEQVMLEHIVIFNLTMMEHCDAVFMMPNWKYSLEAEAERAHALMLRKPVFYRITRLAKHLQGGVR